MLNNVRGNDCKDYTYTMPYIPFNYQGGFAHPKKTRIFIKDF